MNSRLQSFDVYEKCFCYNFLNFFKRSLLQWDIIINFQDSILCKNILLTKSTVTFYHREPKSVITFNLFTFFHADINQSEVEDSFQLASDWIKSIWKNVNKSKAVTLLGSLLQSIS